MQQVKQEDITTQYKSWRSLLNENQFNVLILFVQVYIDTINSIAYCIFFYYVRTTRESFDNFCCYIAISSSLFVAKMGMSNIKIRMNNHVEMMFVAS